MRPVHLLAVAALSLLLVGCVADAGSDASAAEAGVAVDGTVTVQMAEMSFDPEVVTVPAGEPVTFELSNEGGVVHDLTWEGGASPVVDPGSRVTMEAGPFERTVTAWCDLPGHRAAGMELEIRVQG